MPFMAPLTGPNSGADFRFIIRQPVLRCLMKDDSPTIVNLVDLDFMDARARLLDLASFLDRVERAGQMDDYRVSALLEALPLLSNAGPDRAEKILLSLSDPTSEPIAEAHTKGAAGAWEANS